QMLAREKTGETLGGVHRKPLSREVGGIRQAIIHTCVNRLGRRNHDIMASIYDLKPKFQGFLRPFCRRLAGAGVTANQVTILAILISIAHGGALAIWPGNRLVLILLPITLFMRMALNAIDGMLAREHG